MIGVRINAKNQSVLGQQPSHPLHDLFPMIGQGIGSFLEHRFFIPVKKSYLDTVGRGFDLNSLVVYLVQP